MKMLMVLALVVMFAYMLLNVLSGEALANVYCNNKAKTDTPRNYDSGLRVRDKESERENFDVCIDNLENSSLLDVLLKYTGFESESNSETVSE